MKKIISVITVFLLVQVSGQDLKYGVTANFHQSSITGVHDVSKGKFGGGGGIFVQIPLVEGDIFDSSWLYLMPQVEYNMMGENAKAEVNTLGTQKFDTSYLSAQLYIKYFFNSQGVKGDVFVFGGPRVEFLLSNKRDVTAAYDAVYYQYNLDDEMNDFGYGVSLGTGLQVSPKIDAFIRYDQGFSNVYPKNNLNNTRNRMLAVGINYFLNRDY